MKRNASCPSPCSGTEISATAPPATVLWPRVQSNWSLPGFCAAADTGTDRYQPGKKGKKKEQCLGSALCQHRVSAVHICNSNAVAGVLRQGCAGPSTSVSLLAHCEEVVSDSRWGCSPIRLRLLEDDEWGWLRGAREKWRHRQTRDAHSCLGEWV